MDQSRGGARRETIKGGSRGMVAGLAVFLGICLAAGAVATFTSNAQTSENHGKAGTLSSTVVANGTAILYGTPGLSGYGSCVQAAYGPSPTTDVVTNFTNVAPGDKCAASYVITDTGSLPGYLSSVEGASSYGICSTPTQVNCYDVTDSLAGATNVTIAAGGTLTWTVAMELAPGSTTQGIAGSYIANVHEWIGS